MRSFLDSALGDASSAQAGDASIAARKISGVSSTHFLKLVEENGNTGFWTCDITTGQCSCSPGLLRVIGVKQTLPFRMTDLVDQVHPEDRTFCEDIWSLIRSGVPVNRNFRIIRGDRTVRWVEFRSEVVLDAEQRPARAIGLLQDVSQQHESRQALDESTGRYRALISAVATMEWRATAAGEPVFSSGWTTLTGQRESDMFDGNWLSAVHPDDREAVNAAWQQAVSSLSPYSSNQRIRRADGEYEWFHARAVPVLHKGGRSHEWLGMIIRHQEFAMMGRGGSAADPSVTPMQIRAGRAMLQWTLEDLSRQSGVSVSSIRRIEGEGERSTRPASLSAIREAFEREGLAFSDGNTVSLQGFPMRRS